MNSYQKVKKEKQEILRDLMVLVDNKDFFKICEVRAKYKMRSDLEKMAWAGNPEK